MPSESTSARAKKPSLLARLFRKGKKSTTVPLVLPVSQAVKPIPPELMVKGCNPDGGSQVAQAFVQNDQYGRVTDSPNTSPTISPASAAFTANNYLAVPTQSQYHGSDSSMENDSYSWYSSGVDSEAETSISTHPSPIHYSPGYHQGYYQDDAMVPSAMFQSSPTSGIFPTANNITAVTQMTTYTRNNPVVHHTYNTQSVVHQRTDNSVRISGNNTINIQW